MVDMDAPFDLPRTLGSCSVAMPIPPSVWIQVPSPVDLEEHRGRCMAGSAAIRHRRPTRGAVALRFDQLDTSRVKVHAISDSGEALGSALDRVPTLLGAEDDWSEVEFLLDALGTGSPPRWPRCAVATQECDSRPQEGCSTS